jgi:putative protein kinase ArgK-like GTPase of G3E family
LQKKELRADRHVISVDEDALDEVGGEAGSVRVVVLVGIPGSGKSFVANVFRKEGWVVVSQDELGDRRTCEAAARQAYADVC